MDQIRMTGRSAQGVSVINVGTGDIVASLATIDMGADKPGGDDGAKQTELDGMEADAAAQDSDDAPKRGKKPTPIRPNKPARAAAPAPKKATPAMKKPPSKPAAKKAAANGTAGEERHPEAGRREEGRKARFQEAKAITRAVAAPKRRCLKISSLICRAAALSWARRSTRAASPTRW
jgi:hypothetical protein